jgi:hypothetical protein
MFIKYIMAFFLAFLTLFSPAYAATDSVAKALKMADFILTLQDAGGAIKDSPGGTVCNEDSNMEYALLGLAAAYKQSGNPKYLVGFEKGVVWLTDRIDMSTEWRGSFFYTYACSPPYAHIATSPGSGVKDVRGVDTTSAYLPYLLYVHSRITNSPSLSSTYAVQAKAALDFVVTHNLTAKGTTSSSYQLKKGKWVLWPYEYTADQADVYLGFMGASVLYDTTERQYGKVADKLKLQIPALFYDTKAKRYAMGLDDGALDWSDEFDAIFPQGYAVWALGPSPQSTGATNWLKSKVRKNGKIVGFPGDPGFSLSAAEYLMAAHTLGQLEPASTTNWLLTVPYVTSTGGVKDSAQDSTQYSNVAAFSILGLLGQSSEF